MNIQTNQTRLTDEKKLIITSFAASGLSGFFGAAGALFFNWIVQWWLGRDMKRVNGLALFTISLSVITSITIRILWPIQTIHVDWHKTNILLTSILSAIMGVILGKHYETRLKERHLRQLFIGILLFVGLKLLGFLPAPLFSFLSVSTGVITVIWSLMAGISSPVLGIGTGIFTIPLFLGIGFSNDEAILMSLIITALSMLLGAWFFYKAKQLEICDLRYVWPAAIMGAPAGVWLSYQISSEYFQSLFGILLIVAACKSLYDISAYLRHVVRIVFSFHKSIKRGFLISAFSNRIFLKDKI